MSIQKTVKSVFQVYNAELNSEIHHKISRIDLWLLLYSLNSKVERLPAFEETIRLMNEDNEMRMHYNKPVGTLSSAVNVGGAKDFLFRLLFQLYKDQQEYSEGVVKTEYKRLKKYKLKQQVKRYLT